MTRTTLIATALAALIVLAGCTGAGPDALASSSTPTHAPGSMTGEATGTVDFYVSDQPNAIGDFAHLNVTIDRVVMIRADATDEEAADDDDSEERERVAEDEREDENETTPTPTGNATMTATANATPSPTPTATAVNESDDGEAAETGRLTFDVDDRAVDLTQLRGANATLLAQFDVPAGSYEKVFLEVSEVNATLTTGERVNVKLPSEKLQLTKPFEVSANDSTAFVFDIAVHKAGKSGKYILRPVIGESGTDVPIEPIDDDREEDNEAEEVPDLAVSVLGNVTAGSNVTISVTQNDTAVANATVSVNDEEAGTTDATGHLTVTVPSDADSFEIEVEAGEAEGELEIEFGDDRERDDGEQDDDREAGPPNEDSRGPGA